MNQKRAELPACAKSAMFTPIFRLTVLTVCLAPPIWGFAFDKDPHSIGHSAMDAEQVDPGWGFGTSCEANPVLVRALGDAGFQLVGTVWGTFFEMGNTNQSKAFVAVGSGVPWIHHNRLQSESSTWTKSRAVHVLFTLLAMISLIVLSRFLAPVRSAYLPQQGIEGIRGLDKPIGLETSESGWRTILDSAAVSIVVINDQDIIEAFNRSAENLFGYSVREVIGKKVDMIMPAQPDCGLEGCLIQHMGDNQRIVSKGPEFVGRRKDGSLFPMELIVTDTRLDNRHFSTGVIRDLT